MVGQLFGDGFGQLRTEMPEKGMPPRTEHAHEAVNDQDEASEFKESFDDEFLFHEILKKIARSDGEETAGANEAVQGEVEEGKAKVESSPREAVRDGPGSSERASGDARQSRKQERRRYRQRVWRERRMTGSVKKSLDPGTRSGL
jgi:hypothetical protein